MSAAEVLKSFASPEFLSRLQDRDRDAIEAVVRAYTEQLVRGALGLGFDTHQAKDLAQSVWATFFDVVSKFEGRSHVRTFIFGILYNKAMELRREQNRFDTRDPVEEILEQRFDSHGHWIRPPMSPDQFVETSETLELIEKCLDTLPLTQRMAFCLKEIDEHGSSDICKIMDVTVTNLGVLLYRARNRLRECIEGKATPKVARG